MVNRKNIWSPGPSKIPKPKVTDFIKAKVSSEAQKLIETVLKPEHIKARAEDEKFNYIVDIFSKWHSRYFYFCSRYACPGPGAISPYFENKFARMEYIGKELFNLAFMRHTGQRCEIYHALTIKECMDSIKDEPFFQP